MNFRRIALVFALGLWIPLGVLAQNAGWVRPSGGVVSYPFFSESYARSENVQHVGVDIDGEAGEVVVSPVSGTVIINRTDRADIMNAYLIIREEGTNLEHVLAHISSSLRQDARVRQGEFVGTIREWNGNEHVHWGVFRGNMLASFVNGWGFGRIPINITKAEAMAKGWKDPLAGRVAAPPATRPGGPSQPRIPATPAVSGPGDASDPGPVQSRRRVTLSWSAVSGATTYDLGVRDLETDRLVFDDQVPGTSHVIVLDAGKRYRWNVAACNQAGCSRFSAPLFFRAPGDAQRLAPPPVPQPTSTATPSPRPTATPSPRPTATPSPRPMPTSTPTGSPAAQVPVTPTAIGPGTTREPGPQQAGTRVTLEWNAVRGAVEYDVGVRDLVTNQLVFDRRVSGTAQRITLEPGRRYRWNVAACNVAGCSRFTVPLHFTLAAATGGGGGSSGSVPDVPRDLSPGRSSEPGQRMSIESITLQWAEVRAATHYEVDLRDLTSRRVIELGRLKQRFHILKMKKGVSYRWRVRACNTNGCSAWSDRLYFTSPR